MVSDAPVCNDLAWVALGDWGEPGEAQKQVLRQTALEAERTKAQFALLVGDNFYPAGVSRWDDTQFTTTYEERFAAPALRIPHYAVLGNHDYLSGHPEAQVERHYKVQSNWTLPNRWYTKEFSLSCMGIPGAQGSSSQAANNTLNNETPQEVHGSLVERNATVLFIFIDTMVLAHGGLWDGIEQMERDEHWQWLEDALASHQADWVIVVGHHPIFSAGDHGDSRKLLKHLAPLLRYHGVDAYIAGHDHDQQLLLDVTGSKGPSYLISGSASKLREYVQYDHPRLRFADNSYGFLSMRLNGSHLSSTWLADDGRVSHVYIQEPRWKPWKSRERSSHSKSAERRPGMFVGYHWQVGVKPPPVNPVAGFFTIKATALVLFVFVMLFGLLLKFHGRRPRFTFIGAVAAPSGAREVCAVDTEGLKVALQADQEKEDPEMRPAHSQPTTELAPCMGDSNRA